MVAWKRVLIGLIFLALLPVAVLAAMGVERWVERAGWPRNYAMGGLCIMVGLGAVALRVSVGQESLGRWFGEGAGSHRRWVVAGLLLVALGLGLIGLEYLGGMWTRQTTEEIERINREIERSGGQR